MRKPQLRLAPNILYGIVKKIKDTRGKVIQTVRKVVCGSSASIERILMLSPVSQVLNTSFVERLNGTFRALCSRLVRKTYSFSKKPTYHDDHIMVVACYYNFIKPHKTLTQNSRNATTPAIAIGITDHCWTWQELCNFSIPRQHY